MLSIYALAFFELGGGCVCSIALSASSNLIGASVSLSVFLCGFFFDRFFTYSLSAPSGQVPMVLNKQIKLACQPRKHFTGSIRWRNARAFDRILTQDIWRGGQRNYNFTRSFSIIRSAGV
jgi:hypothetical protein